MTTTIPPATLFAEVARTLEAAFAGRATIGVRELAELIRMDRATIIKHIKAGDLVGRIEAAGENRRRRAFTIADVARFLRLLSDK
jgi:hypothetical protein